MINVGKLVFAALYVVLVVWLWIIPNERIGYEAKLPRPWCNVRYWALCVALLQVVVYLWWG